IWKRGDGKVAKTDDDFDCGSTGTCILCYVFAYPPWPGNVSPIINFRGEVHCYRPDLNWLPAQVALIQLQVGLGDAVTGQLLGLTPPLPLSQSWATQLGLTGAIPAVPASNCGTGFLQSVAFVYVVFGQCCPVDAIGEFGSEVRQITC